MNIIFTNDAWFEYVEWQQDKAVIKKINELIKDIIRSGFDKGIGKPEPLKHGFAGFWSRRITLEHRLVYVPDKANNLCIISCKGHYKD